MYGFLGFASEEKNKQDMATPVKSFGLDLRTHNHTLERWKRSPSPREKETQQKDQLKRSWRSDPLAHAMLLYLFWAGWVAAQVLLHRQCVGCLKHHFMSISGLVCVCAQVTFV